MTTARETLRAHPDLRAAVANSTSFRSALVALGLEPLKNNVHQLRTLCTDMGISVAHIQNKKKHEDTVSVCPKCGTEFQNKTGGKEHKTYCGQKCANAALAKTRNQQEINAKIKVATQQAMDKIAETKDTPSTINVVCATCKSCFTVKWHRRSRKYCSRKCKENFSASNSSCNKANKQPSRTRGHPDVTIKCGACFESFDVEWQHRNRKYCSRSCASSVTGKKYGSIIGRLSAQKMVKRSRNEIHFADLCAEKWTVVCNEPMFDGWDADVVIPDLKVAVLWNGAWHYKDKIRKGHSLLQVQTRDRIKLDVIDKHGYQSYVVKDMGRHNPDFVREEFKKFVEWCEVNAVSNGTYQEAPGLKPEPPAPEQQEAAAEMHNR